MIGIAATFLKELAWAMIAKLSFKVLVERFASRVLVWSLEKLKSSTENTLVDDTVDDVLVQLSGKKLPVIENHINSRLK